MIKLGIKAGSESGPLDLLDMSIMADQSGFDFMDFSQPAASNSSTAQVSFNWAWLGAAAVKTQKLHLGPGIHCSTLRNDPAVIAQAAQTLAAMAPGRAYISISSYVDPAGSMPPEGWLDQNEQQDMLGEAIELIRELWTGQLVTYNGHYFHVRKARMNTRCAQSLPIFVSVQDPGSAYFAGYAGDGLITSGGLQSKVYSRILKEFARGAREAGKDPGLMVRMVDLAVEYQTEPLGLSLESILQNWEDEPFEPQIGEEAYIPVTGIGNGQAFPALKIKQAQCVSGDPMSHVNFAQEYIDLGFNHLVFHSAGESESFMDAYARDVLPNIRGRNR